MRHGFYVDMLEATTRENSWFSDFQNIQLLHSRQHRNLIQMKGYVAYHMVDLKQI